MRISNLLQEPDGAIARPERLPLSIAKVPSFRRDHLGYDRTERTSYTELAGHQQGNQQIEDVKNRHH
jgi:hypothetical protein